VRVVRLWPLVAGLLLVLSFGLLEQRGAPAAVRASFTLVGLVDCGQPSGRTCLPGQMLTLVSDDSGATVPYVVDLSWVKDKLPDGVGRHRPGQPRRHAA
jgi:hypothetical protein